MAENKTTPAIKRAEGKRRGTQPGDKKVNRHKGRKPVFHPSDSYLAGLADDVRQEVEAAREERRAQEQARKAAFAERHLAEALQAPQVVKDRKNGGLEGFGRELAERLINQWAGTPNQEGKGRLGVAMAALEAELFDDQVKSAIAKGATRAEALVKADEWMQRTANLRRVVKSHAFQAIDYGFKRAKAKEAVEA